MKNFLLLVGGFLLATHIYGILWETLILFVLYYIGFVLVTSIFDIADPEEFNEPTISPPEKKSTKKVTKSTP